MTLRCLLFGHRRSRSRATYDEKRGRWISACKRCHVLLEREDHHDWRPLTPPPGKLERVADEPAAPITHPSSEGTGQDHGLRNGPDLTDDEPLIGAGHRRQAQARPKAEERAS